MSQPAPTFLVQLTDPHVHGEEPWRLERLTAAVDAVLALGVQPAGVVVTGDLADRGDPAEYAVVAGQLARIDAPLVVLPGNKDDRATMRAAFGLPGAPADRVQGVAVCGGLRVIACDTQIPASFRVTWTSTGWRVSSRRIVRRRRSSRCITRRSGSVWRRSMRSGFRLSSAQRSMRSWRTLRTCCG